MIDITRVDTLLKNKMQELEQRAKKLSKELTRENMDVSKDSEDRAQERKSSRMKKWQKPLPCKPSRSYSKCSMLFYALNKGSIPNVNYAVKRLSLSGYRLCRIPHCVLIALMKEPN